MGMAKVAVTMDEELLARVDRLVKERVFPSRSRAVQEAVAEKLSRLGQGRLARECAKLDPRYEQALAEEGLAAEGDGWPEY
ncbi:MAG: ribbon-helix-helix domain-containing protein [Thermodesulfobacteriota bacterium]